eukprot:CAMPEP_0184492178 /NCGR_PEP_ID=MMETSP0113_2-20130426/22499_1 /TAXON_ID=91329 /ORGANISM="Norrisiella sphaerica, Strain BC52" /LENGTH=468 /DNA_ID=CAMNT_0026876847 /DNA_START=373 /DNA_END=1779 /DNA_ORIENTATION=-
MTRRMENLVSASGPERWRWAAHKSEDEISSGATYHTSTHSKHSLETQNIGNFFFPTMSTLYNTDYRVTEAEGNTPTKAGVPTHGRDNPRRPNSMDGMVAPGYALEAPMLSPGEGEAGSHSPTFLPDDYCLEPGEPVIRIEKAPGNAVRIFTGVDILSPMDAVWSVLTDYEGLQDVIPNLVESSVLEHRPCGGARICQVGAAAVMPGVRFTAKMTLDVGIHMEDNPLPDDSIASYVTDPQIPSEEVREMGRNIPIQRGVFPRPYAITNLPHRDITMVNVPEEPGDFEFYQGIWRVQPLPECAPDGTEAARLTYAVEIKPKGLLPVRLIEKRIASDLKTNLQAIRDEAQRKADEVHTVESDEFSRNEPATSRVEESQASAMPQRGLLNIFQSVEPAAVQAAAVAEAAANLLYTHTIKPSATALTGALPSNNQVSHGSGTGTKATVDIERIAEPPILSSRPLVALLRHIKR